MILQFIVSDSLQKINCMIVRSSVEIRDNLLLLLGKEKGIPIEFELEE